MCNGLCGERCSTRIGWMPARDGRARRQRCGCSAGAASGGSSCCAANWPVDLAMSDRTKPSQPLLGFAEVGPDKELWEYAALVTSLDNEILTLGQLYRDRADAENV